MEKDFRVVHVGELNGNSNCLGGNEKKKDGKNITNSLLARTSHHLAVIAVHLKRPSLPLIRLARRTKVRSSQNAVDIKRK